MKRNNELKNVAIIRLTCFEDDKHSSLFCRAIYSLVTFQIYIIKYFMNLLEWCIASF